MYMFHNYIFPLNKVKISNMVMPLFPKVGLGHMIVQCLTSTKLYYDTGEHIDAINYTSPLRIVGFSCCVDGDFLLKTC